MLICNMQFAHPSRTMSRSGAHSSKSSTPRRTSAYNPKFSNHLREYGIHDQYSSREPANFAAIEERLAQRRPSLSPSQFSQGALRQFSAELRLSRNESALQCGILPDVMGNHRRDFATGYNDRFNNLRPLTDGSLVRPQPDMWDGSRAALPRVTDELGSYILSRTDGVQPIVAPNFFGEFKGPRGDLNIADLQAQYDGAVGAQGIFTLQNYGRETAVYDNNAYTMSATLGSGALRMYAHHPTEPAEPGGPPEYHMTHVAGWLLDGSAEQCRQGLGAFRNGRDFAKEQRDNFIEAANAEAKTKPPIPLDLTVPEIGDLPYDAQRQGGAASDDDSELDIPPNELNSTRADEHMYRSEEISRRRFKGSRRRDPIRRGSGALISETSHYNTRSYQSSTSSRGRRFSDMSSARTSSRTSRTRASSGSSRNYQGPSACEARDHLARRSTRHSRIDKSSSNPEPVPVPG